MAKMEEGPITGSYVRDVRVCVYDGKMHAVDSNDISFKIAGTMAFKDAFMKAEPQLLEPIYNLEVVVPEEIVGDVMGDLQTRRSLIMGIHKRQLSGHQGPHTPGRARPLLHHAPISLAGPRQILSDIRRVCPGPDGHANETGEGDEGE
jgi:translation elongation factor EF-G